MAGAGAEPSINKSIELFRVVFSWGEWEGVSGVEAFSLTILYYLFALGIAVIIPLNGTKETGEKR